MTPDQIDIIQRGLQTVRNVASPNDRAALLRAAGELLPEGHPLAIDCQATASVLLEAERCQLNFWSDLESYKKPLK